MKIVRNRWIPFGKFAAINIFGIFFVRDGVVVSDRLLRHESIHTRQMRELLYLPFYLIYCLEWLVRVMVMRNFYKSYRMISFEREAYENDNDISYLTNRPRFAQWRK